MKAHKVFLLTLTSGVVSMVSVHAGGHHGHGGGSGPASSGAPSVAAARPSYGSYRGGGFRYSGRMIGSSQRLAAMRSGGAAFSPHSVRSGGTNSFSGRQYSNRSGGSIRSGSRGLRSGSNHVFARYSANWQRNWNRHRDHWWHGHRCRFIDGSWVLFDLGFYPSWYGYPFYAYYPYYYDGYPYSYDGDIYDSAPVDYDDRGAYESSDEGAGSPIAEAQQELARRGYYRGEIDGIVGPQTRRAVMRYQSRRGLAPTGRLNGETLDSLGIR